MKFLIAGLVIPIVLLSGIAQGQQIFASDVLVQGSLCMGADCADPEDFGFDTLRIKGSDPSIEFEDTSASASFPSNDWSMGLANTGPNGAPQFIITDESAGNTVMILESGAGAGVALGAGSTVESAAISVGSAGAERRIAHVGEGVAATDAATRSQLDDYIASADEELDGEIETLQLQIDSLTARLSFLENVLD